MKPTFDLRIWKSELGVIGCQMAAHDMNQDLKRYPEQYRMWLLSGRTAVCRVMTDDEQITRDDAIAYARNIVNRTFTIMSFDLNRCEVTWKRIFPEPPPF
jgi:hypothetical protein